MFRNPIALFVAGVVLLASLAAGIIWLVVSEPKADTIVSVKFPALTDPMRFKHPTASEYVSDSFLFVGSLYYFRTNKRIKRIWPMFSQNRADSIDLERFAPEYLRRMYDFPIVGFGSWKKINGVVNVWVLTRHGDSYEVAPCPLRAGMVDFFDDNEPFGVLTSNYRVVKAIE